ncbi:hypothetical protein Fcan01_15352 [Folsomia candida]|uniref:Uncharacterized protein n=1 Tax=Folsomia candida TaxID=158441 RepID=A0A226DUS2_FOLCA|nr:hypothetical protein Fcan01_15352 [Folsomia candida]
MATLGMWKHFELLSNLYGKKLHLLYNHEVDVSDKKIHLVSSNAIRKSGTFIKTSTIFVALHTMLCFAIVIKPIFVKNSEESGNLELIRSFVTTLAGIISAAFFAMSYVISFTPNVSILIVNCIVHFQQKAKALTTTQIPHNYTIIGMKFMLWISFMFPLFGTPIAIYLQLDPLFELVLMEYVPPGNIPFVLVRFVVAVFGSTEVIKSANAFFIVGLMVVCSMNDIMQDLNDTASAGIFSFKNTLHRFREIRLYKEMFIWHDVIILTYYGTIRMAGKLDLLSYSGLPLTAICGTLFVVILIPHAANVVEHSSNFLDERRNEVSFSKFERKRLKSLRPLGIQSSGQLCGNLELIRSFVTILVGFLSVAFLAMSYVISFTPNVSIVIVNCIVHFQRKAKELTTSNILHNYAVIEFGMKFMLWISFIAPFASPIVIYLQLDPLFELVVMEFVPPVNIPFVLLRIIVPIIASTEVIKSANAFFIVGLMVVCSMNDIMQDLAGTSCFKNTLQRFQEIRLYKEMFIWHEYANQNFCSFSVPPLIFFGVGVVILTYFGTIRMVGKLDFLVYTAFPLTAICGTLFVVMMIPHAANVVENASNFLDERRNEVSLSKFERQRLKSLRPLGIQIYVILQGLPIFRLFCTKPWSFKVDKFETFYVD